MIKDIDKNLNLITKKSLKALIILLDAYYAVKKNKKTILVNQIIIKNKCKID